MSYRAFEQITVANASIGFTEATIVEGGGHRQVTHVLARCRTAELSYTVDGTTPTASVGMLLEVGDVLRLDDPHEIRRFRAIRVGSSGQLDCAYSDEPMGAVMPAASVSASVTAGTEFAADAAYTGSDKGVQALGVRRDADTSLVGTTGDYSPLLLDASGYLKVNVKTGGGGGPADGATFTATSTTEALAGAAYESSPSTVADGKQGALAQ